MPTDPNAEADLDRVASDWLVRIQLGDATGPVETARGRISVLTAFEAWRGADPAHAAAYERVKASMAKVDVAAGGTLVANSRLTRLPFVKRHPFVAPAIAAGLAATFGLLSFYMMDPSQRALIAGSEAANPVSDAVYVTMLGETRQIGLPDGSTVLLDADSQLRVHFSAEARELRLDHGRARFTVAHDASRPFAVDAGDGRVIAHGTIFDVAIGAGGVRVALLRGAVEVRLQRGPSAQNVTARNLTPGQLLSFSQATDLPLPSLIKADELDWVSGRASFNEARLGDAVEEINRYNRQKIVLGDPQLGELRVSGGFDARKPKAFAQIAAQALGLTLVERPDGQLSLAGKNGPMR